MNHETARLQELDKRLQPRLVESTLDSRMETADIFRAMDGFPKNPSLTLTVYALHRERILQWAAVQPYDTLTDANVDNAATRLCLVYLQRIGFLLSFTYEDGRVNWTVNPLHPQKRTLQSLKIASPAIHRFARFVLEFEEVKAAEALEQISSPSTGSRRSLNRKSRGNSRRSGTGRQRSGGATS
jgi:hypothetical protein